MDLSLKSILKEHRSNIIKGSIWLFGIDIVGLMMPLFVKLAIDRLDNKALPSWLPAFVHEQSVMGFLLMMCLLYMIFAAFVACGRYWWRVHFIWGTFPIFDRVRRGLFGHLSRLHLEFFKSTKVGDLISVLSNDTENMRMALAIGALMFVDSIFSFVLFPAFLFWLDPFLATLIVPPLIIVALLAVPWSARFSKYYDRVQDVMAELSSKAYEIASGIRVIKSFGREMPIHKEFVSKSGELRDASVRVAQYGSMYMPGLYFVLGLAVCTLLAVGGYRVIEGHMSLSNFVAFSLYLNMMDWPMMAMGWFIQVYRSARASERRVLKLKSIENPLIASSQPAEIFTPSFLVVKNLGFQFSDRKQELFGGVDLEIQKGEWIGLTGSVGVGKTIFLELLSRQRDPSQGEIYLGGKALRGLAAEEIVGRILFVPQEAYLFSKSVRQNLNIGLESRLGDDDLWELLKDLSFDADVLKARGGLDARLGERGVNLSGGQKQRLSLGRALVRSRDLYLLDDLFSHVDVETEAQLVQVLRQRIPKAATVILTSQRLETLGRCDRLLVLGDGGVEFFGKLEEGRKASPFLKALEDVQAKRDIA